MGLIISQLYKVGTMTGGCLGVAIGVNKHISNGLYGFVGTNIEDIVNSFPFFLQGLARTPIEVVPYALALYAIYEGGGKLTKLL